MPDLDRELFVEWCNNDELYFLDQDEDLIIAEVVYIDYILEMIDKNIASEAKKPVLFSALCVIVYDELKLVQTKAGLSTSARRVLKELDKRKNLLLSSEGYIWPYVKEKVFPLLGLK